MADRPLRARPGLLAAAAVLVTALSATGVAPTPAGAQTVLLDEGAFRITVAGRAIGTETFAIRRVGQGAEAHVIASADVQVERSAGTELAKPLLQTDADRQVLAYQLEVAGPETLEIAVTSSGRRLLARTRTPEGGQEREFRASAGGVVLEEGVAHHYWFLSRLPEGATAAALVPRAGEQGRLEIRSVRSETLRLGGAEVAARHVTCAVDGDVREVWFDGDGRVLRVRIPSAGWAADRTER